MSSRIIAVVCRTVALLLATLISACSYEATPVRATGAADVAADVATDKTQKTKSVDSASLIAVSGSNVNPDTNKSAKAVAETTVQTSETPATQKASALSAELSTGQLVVEAGESMTLSFTVANNTKKSHRILTWASPLEAEISGVMFRVMATGDTGTEEKEIPFAGLMVRRGPPPDEAFIDLAPGEKVTNSVSLDSSYDVSQPGQYSIEFQPLTTTGNDSFMMGEAEVDFGNRNVTITRR